MGAAERRGAPARGFSLLMAPYLGFTGDFSWSLLGGEGVVEELEELEDGCVDVEEDVPPGAPGAGAGAGAG